MTEEGPGTGDLVARAAPLIARETELDEEVEPAGNIDHYSRPDAEVVGIRGRHATIIIGPSAEIIADIGKQVGDEPMKGCGDADIRVHVEGRSVVTGGSVPQVPAGDAQTDVSVQNSAVFRPDGENAAVVSCILQVEEDAAVGLVRGGGTGVRVPLFLGCRGNGGQSKYEGYEKGKMFHFSGCFQSNMNIGSPPLWESFQHISLEAIRCRPNAVIRVCIHLIHSLYI